MWGSQFTVSFTSTQRETRWVWVSGSGFGGLVLRFGGLGCVVKGFGVRV